LGDIGAMVGSGLGINRGLKMAEREGFELEAFTRRLSRVPKS
jgi:hypothetical protein